MSGPVPPLLQRLSSDEYRALPWRPVDVRVLRDLLTHRAPRVSRGVGINQRLLLGYDRRGTAMTLRAIDAAHGGGFYEVAEEAEFDEDVARETLGGPPGSPLVDVQTHLTNPTRWRGDARETMTAFLRGTDPDRWADGVDPERLSAGAWATHVFGESETGVALLTSTPGREHENILTNPEIADVRDITDRYAGTRRVLTHSIVHPNLGPAELERMTEWRERLDPAGWKTYTLWDPPELVAERGEARGWFLDDEVGIAFLERVRDLGPRVVATHKGIGGPIPGHSVAGSSPRDVGPAALRFPDVRFLVYHSGYEPDPNGEEGPYPGFERAEEMAGDLTGVDRLVHSLSAHGIGHQGNVYAELGSTWFMMIRRPAEAAHVLGKLLLAVGEDRILWGTDCIWYGSPQPLIDAFRAFTIPERMQEEFGYPPLTPTAKVKILGLNACEVYGLDPASVPLGADGSWVAAASRELGERILGD